MTKVYQMLWDCQFCGTAKLLAKTHRACPKCRAPQDPSRRYLPSDADTVEVKNYTFQGKDKQCAACDALNGATANFCRSCGTSLTDANVLPTNLSSGQGDGTFTQSQAHNVWSLEEQVRITDEALTIGRWPDETPDETEQPLAKKKSTRGLIAQKPVSQGRTKKLRSLFDHSTPIEKLGLSVFGCLGCAIYGPILIATMLGAVAALSSALWQEPAATTPTVPIILRVTGHRWQRTIDVEKYQRLTKDDWENRLPRDAMYHKSISCEDRERETDDGLVNASYCTYNVDRWQSSKQVVAAGDSLAEEPHWPNPDFKACDDIKLGCRREGARGETYTLKLIDPIEDKQHTCNVSYDVWQTSPIGTRVKVLVKFGSGLRDSDCQQMEFL
ncbi:hypothetical protein [Leptothoe kymatousa]|uniref:Zinc ribbon domain-containing protein n=1 Tax=Leptothoe kymatousa TAU-MAC 1615 TaxID=2364775 RepID=A0ABS5Y7H7_9CYAN|nr:hypothetical protein [Leptothoe kymatousa]MBT9313561.1 hypothetical protein [Leptothoe kymatousa TAU-MAC 1615]